MLHYSKIFWLIATLAIFFACVAYPQESNLQTKINVLGLFVEQLDGMVFSVEVGTFSSVYQTHSWNLERDRNYRIFIVMERPLQDVDVSLELYKEAKHPVEVLKIEGTNIECYHWKIMTFRSTKATLTLYTNPKNLLVGSYAVILASAGRESTGFLPVTKLNDSRGNVYELIDNIVYRNGKKYYEDRRADQERFVSICVTNMGALYVLTSEGNVFSKGGSNYRSSRHKVIKMVSSHTGRFYMFTTDFSVIGFGGQTIYKRSKENRAVDLVEEEGHVWVITKEGERISLR